MQPILSTRQLGELLSQPEWRIRRLFELGILPEPTRFCGRRAIPSENIPQIVDALRLRGWMPPAEDEAVVTTKANHVRLGRRMPGLASMPLACAKPTTEGQPE